MTPDDRTPEQKATDLCHLAVAFLTRPYDDGSNKLKGRAVTFRLAQDYADLAPAVEKVWNHAVTEAFLRIDRKDVTVAFGRNDANGTVSFRIMDAPSAGE